MEEAETTAPQFGEVQARFFQKVSTKEILVKKSDWLKALTVADQEKLLRMTITSDTCRDYPVANGYQQRFLKGWIQLLEDSGIEISDMLYESYGNILSSGKMKEELNYKTFMLSDGYSLIVEESTMMLSHGTTGLQIWPAAYWLAEWVLENKHIFSNKSVLELGCGVGFTGLVACMACRIDQYNFTDWHYRVLQSLYHNLRLNLQERTCPHAAVCKQCLTRFENSEGNLGALCAMMKNVDISKTAGESHSRTGSEMDNSCEMSGNLTSWNVDQYHGVFADFHHKASINESDSIHLCPDPSSSVSPAVDTKACQLCDSTSDSLCDHSVKIQSSSSDDPRNGMENTASAGTALRRSVDRDSCHSTTVHLASLDWEQGGGDVKECIHPDVILAADVIFEPKLISPLVRTLKHFLGRSAGCVAFIASSVRNQETYGQFLEELAAESIASEELTHSPSQMFHYDRSACPIKLLKLHSN